MIKVAVIGPESTGKSTLALQLAKHYQTVWVPEYARYYCSYLGKDPVLQDEVNMFYGQIALEESLEPLANRLLICDVTILNVKVFCEEVFNECPEFIIEEVKNRFYDLYLLTDIDMPWEDDPLRGFPHRREYFFERYKKELEALNATYRVVSGLGEKRLQCAVRIIEELKGGEITS
ncbi:NadR type nicotinamide-nucleotide adenylyltransferase [Anseongella ginsenosidimutans]|uniref:NadR type nicotinamide-nucleotide adenylyltransferase n=1 Tax=Anseongella ginsenosidimutans TaxID=496056 RepID=A0A4R3KUM6_9SPHI|nr:ATP-binding protein [Anseongella ginsenosidimutans]QEC51760.1 ATP-binding protein [Anseongella ginsenosidimutans]TCS89127.1 NadR type nicotinamide-nucleotide adenylyltransferase [Anseongella ginsenosidimutans]